MDAAATAATAATAVAAAAAATAATAADGGPRRMRKMMGHSGGVKEVKLTREIDVHVMDLNSSRTPRVGGGDDVGGSEGEGGGGGDAPCRPDGGWPDGRTGRRTDGRPGRAGAEERSLPESTFLSVHTLDNNSDGSKVITFYKLLVIRLISYANKQSARPPTRRASGPNWSQRGEGRTGGEVGTRCLRVERKGW